MKEFRAFLFEAKKWSANVSTSFKPPEGLFTKSGREIAETLLKAGKGKAMRRLMFYINRAGTNLSPKEKTALNRAKSIIEKETSK